MNNGVATKYVIAWLDHEELILHHLAKLGAKDVVGTTHPTQLGDHFSFVPQVIKLGPNLEDDALRSLRELDPAPDLVLVDLSFDDHFEDHYDPTKGRKLAHYLRQEMPFTPVGVYTKYGLLKMGILTVIADRFAMVLEGLDHLLSGVSRLDGDQWRTLFERVIGDAKREATKKPSILVQATAQSIATWAEGESSGYPAGFRTIAPTLAQKALNWVGPTSIRLSRLTGGYSGSYVLKAEVEPYRDKSYVIKMDEEPSKLKRELDGYQELRKRVQPDYYLELPNPENTTPVTLADDWWGAIVMTFDGGGSPLIKLRELDGHGLAQVYSRIWRECLVKLYEPIGSGSLSLRSLFSGDVKTAARFSWNSLDRYYQRMKESLSAPSAISWEGWTPEAHSEEMEGLQAPLFRDRCEAVDQLEEAMKSVRRAEEFIASVSVEENGEDLIPAPWVDHAHGDLNCRNILYDPKKKTFRLIDFPDVPEPACLAVDFAKAESELILMILDWETGRDCDLDMLATWASATHELSQGVSPAKIRPGGPGIERILPSVLMIREIYVSLHQNLGSPNEAYRMCLLRTVLDYIAYNEIPVAKRCLAMIWAGQLLGSRW